MARTTPELVAAIVDWDTIEVPDLTPFINAAAAIITKVVDPKYDTADPDEVDLLTQVETWLAAHFYRVRDPAISNEMTGPISTSYQYRLAGGLGTTMYGTQAMLLDTSGALAAFSKNIEKGQTGEIRAIWLGTDNPVCDNVNAGCPCNYDVERF